jgi:hypothetical protein
LGVERPREATPRARTVLSQSKRWKKTTREVLHEDADSARSNVTTIKQTPSSTETHVHTRQKHTNNRKERYRPHRPTRGRFTSTNAPKKDDAAICERTNSYGSERNDLAALSSGYKRAIRIFLLQRLRASIAGGGAAAPTKFYNRPRLRRQKPLRFIRVTNAPSAITTQHVLSTKLLA